MEEKIFYTICQTTRQKHGSNIFIHKEKRFAVATLLKSREELMKMTQNLTDKKFRLVKILVKQSSNGKEIEFVEWIK